jgi:osmotically-inducible protein OsmY
MGRDEQRSFGQDRPGPEADYGRDDMGYGRNRLQGYGSTGYRDFPPSRYGEGDYGDAGLGYRGSQVYEGPSSGMGAPRGPGYGSQAYGGQSYQGYGGQGGSEGYGGGASGQGGGGRAFGGWDRGQQSYGQQQGYSQQGRGYGQASAFGSGDNSALQRMSDGDQRGRGPKNYSRADDRIRDDINDRLTDDPWLDASEIEVTVATAEVTLTGTVDTRDDKRRAEDIVEQVSGVKNVQNSLRVQPTGDTASAGQRTAGQGGQQAAHNGHGAQAGRSADEGRSASARPT